MQMEKLNAGTHPSSLMKEKIKAAPRLCIRSLVFNKNQQRLNNKHNKSI